jgi:hypothetical protein
MLGAAWLVSKVPEPEVVNRIRTLSTANEGPRLVGPPACLHVDDTVALVKELSDTIRETFLDFQEGPSGGKIVR